MLSQVAPRAKETPYHTYAHGKKDRGSNSIQVKIESKLKLLDEKSGFYMISFTFVKDAK